MPQPRTRGEKARLVLDLCAEYKLREGHALPLIPFAHKGVKRDITGEEIVDGVRRGAELGWFESTDGDTYFLTSAGYLAT